MLNTDDDRWCVTEGKVSAHNHEPSIAGAHSALRKLAMTSAIQQEIDRQHRTELSSRSNPHGPVARYLQRNASVQALGYLQR